MEEQEFRVEGMTCEHCVEAVRRELGLLAGVTDVAVDLDAGTATVLSNVPLDRVAVGDAIAAAGYKFAQ